MLQTSSNPTAVPQKNSSKGKNMETVFEKVIYYKDEIYLIVIKK